MMAQVAENPLINKMMITVQKQAPEDRHNYGRCNGRRNTGGLRSQESFRQSLRLLGELTDTEHGGGDHVG